MTSLEEFTKQLHQNFYFKEFTYSQTQFSPPGSSNVELADNIIWIDDIFLILQLKQREPRPDESVADVEKWFENKVMKKAVSQVKNTLQYLRTLPEINISNDKAHFFDLAKAPVDNAIKIILYNDNVVPLPKEKREMKFYVSSTAGHIHLFHAEDYMWICQYLVTPTEIRDYLLFREALYARHPEVDSLPEQYILGHFFAGSLSDPLTPGFITSIQRLVDDSEEYDLSFFLSRFADKLISVGENQGDYYYVHKEIVKLSRSELKLFKQRLQLSIDMIKKNEFAKPYRFYIPRLDCGFVFIPLQKEMTPHWRTALHNFTIAHKYDSKASKCIGVVLFDGGAAEGFVEAYWEYAHFDWQHEPELEQILKDDFPFRPVQTKEMHRYFLKDE